MWMVLLGCTLPSLVDSLYGLGKNMVPSNPGSSHSILMVRPMMKNNRTEPPLQASPVFPLVSVVIPARNEGPRIGLAVASLLRLRRPRTDMEVIVVDDGSSDDTAQMAQAAGATVLTFQKNGSHGNPGAARNAGANASFGDPIIFLDADCVVTGGWLEAILDAHAAEATVVGGPLSMPADLPALARCDYYCGAYLVHEKRAPGLVPHHPPANLSVRREAFLKTAGFSEEPPLSHTNEERAWLGELRQAGHQIYFEPRAVACHYNRPGFRNLLVRNYRWGYTAIESKSQGPASRLAWLYTHPRLLIIASIPLAFAHTAYILSCWTRARVFEPLLMLPLVFVSRLAYVAGMTVGGIRWMRSRKNSQHEQRSRPAW